MNKKRFIRSVYKTIEHTENIQVINLNHIYADKHEINNLTMSKDKSISISNSAIKTLIINPPSDNYPNPHRQIFSHKSKPRFTINLDNVNIHNLKLSDSIFDSMSRLRGVMSTRSIFHDPEKKAEEEVRVRETDLISIDVIVNKSKIDNILFLNDRNAKEISMEARKKKNIHTTISLKLYYKDYVSRYILEGNPPKLLKTSSIEVEISSMELSKVSDYYNLFSTQE